MLDVRIKSVYIMAPKTIYNDDEQYHKKIIKLKLTYPNIEFLLPCKLYQDNEDFRQNMHKHLNEVEAGILLTDGGIIGYGCYTEIEILRKQKKPVYYYTEQKLTINFCILLLPEKSWRWYGMVYAV